MDDKTYFSTKAEMKVMYELTKSKFHVFNQVSGKAPFDLVAYKNNQLYRISVKSTIVEAKESGGYPIQIKKVRPNKTKNTIVNFKPDDCDVLAVYIDKLDTVCWIPATKIHTTCMLTIATSEKENVKDQFIMSDLTLDKI